MSRPSKRQPSFRTLIAIFALVVLALSISGCGEKSEPNSSSQAAKTTEPFRLILDFFPNADHVGIYAAMAAGEYRKAGLDVKIETPSSPAAPIQLLLAGQADLSISYEPEVFLARDRGAKVISVGAVVQKPLTSIIALGDRKINTVKDLKDKRIGTAGVPYQAAYLKTVLQHANVDRNAVKVSNVGYNLLPTMLAHRVDATIGGFWNYEGLELKLRKKKPKIMRVDNLGVPSYAELVFVAKRSRLRGASGARVRRFLQATARGYDLVRKDPEFGVNALLKLTTGLDRKLQTASVHETLPIFFPSDKSKPFGYQPINDWARYGEWMVEQKLISSQPNINQTVTNDLLPGQGFKSKK